MARGRSETAPLADQEKERKQTAVKDEPVALTDKELITLLQAENSDAIGPAETELANQQDRALEAYLGHPYGDEMEGRSQVVSRDVANAVDWCIPELLEPFLAQDKAIEFIPEKPEDEEYSKQAADYVHHILFNDNPGFETLFNVCKDGLIQKQGIAKIFWRDTEDTTEDFIEDANVLSVQELQQDETVDVSGIEAERYEDVVEDEERNLEPDMYPDGMVYRVEFTRKRLVQTVGIESVPPEEFRIARRASDLRSTYYCAHEVKLTISEVLDMGFDADLVHGLPSTDDRATERKDVRFQGESKRIDQGGPDKSQNTVTLLEEYVRADRNGDGIGELIQIFRVQNVILEETEVPFIPYFDFTPDPMPHKFYGQSLTDKSFDTQQVNTVLQRQMLDNIYLANLPQKIVNENMVGDDTYSDLLNPRIGSIIRADSVDAIREITTEDRSGATLQAIQFFKSVRGEDTGVTRTPLSLSAEAVDPTKTATEVADQRQSDTIRKRLMVRVFAERFYQPLCEAVLQYVIKYQESERIIQLRGKWVPMDPQGWNSNLKAHAAVGLGFENRDVKVQASKMIMELQQGLTPMGLSSPELIYNNVKKLVDTLGYGFAESYFLDPETPEGQQAMQQAQQAKQQQKDPATLKVEGDLKIAEKKLQLEQQNQQQEHQREMMKIQVKTELEKAKIIADQQFNFTKLKVETVTARTDDQMDFESSLARIEADFTSNMEKLSMEDVAKNVQMEVEAALKKAEIAVEASLEVRAQDLKKETDSNVTNVRFGGKTG